MQVPCSALTSAEGMQVPCKRPDQCSGEGCFDSAFPRVPPEGDTLFALSCPVERAALRDGLFCLTSGSESDESDAKGKGFV